jgi:serine protease Do
MRKTWKYLAAGILGGMIPFAFGYVLNMNSYSSLSEEVLDGNRLVKPVSYSGFPAGTEGFMEASEGSINSVVHVTTKVVRTTVQRDALYEFFYGPGTGGKEYKQYGSGSGSGVIVSSEGYIVTNNHVIDGASEIQVILNDNSQYTATLVGTDPSTDIAVLKIEEANNLRPMPLGNSDDLRVGEWVLAVGNPFNLTSTVTAGIVSAKARNLNLLSDKSSGNVVPIESFIQTDAAVNPGNSGGALVNTRGELVGINTAIASQTGSYSGYSFAVPVNLVQKVMSDIIDFGVVQRAYLGVQIADISQQVKEKNNLASTKGVFVSAVTEDGGADMAGIKPKSVITKIGAKEVNSVAALQEEIGKRRPGDKVTLTLLNDKGETELKDVVLRSAEGQTTLKTKAEISKTSALGATFAPLTEKEKKELGIENGVRIRTLEAGRLKNEGLEEGMVIYKLNYEPVDSPEAVATKLNTIRGDVFLVIVLENGQKVYHGFGL